MLLVNKYLVGGIKLLDFVLQLSSVQFRHTPLRDRVTLIQLLMVIRQILVRQKRRRVA